MIDDVQVSGSLDQTAMVVDRAPQDALSMQVLKMSMDASTASMAALLKVLPDPHPGKGANFDAYA